MPKNCTCILVKTSDGQAVLGKKRNRYYWSGDVIEEGSSDLKNVATALHKLDLANGGISKFDVEEIENIATTKAQTKSLVLINIPKDQTSLVSDPKNRAKLGKNRVKSIIRKS